ncbi:hypothetical protein E2C01_013234 [Portunus trituberculatus]|uniref:Uncharacterized protein n=1 Tax=Portunus trituberculatus TaxID=210409 RepID=A0A5B7DG34_PORTR|nr:hypothetical protein [Portunus trituberculatus]
MVWNEQHIMSRFLTTGGTELHVGIADRWWMLGSEQLGVGGFPAECTGLHVSVKGRRWGPRAASILWVVGEGVVGVI